MDYNLKDKVAVITGAGGALGGEIAKAYANQGVLVAIWDLSLESAKRKSEEIASAGGKAMAIQCDATDKSGVASALAQTLDEYGDVDILVNGAGASRKEASTSPDLSFFDIERDAIDSMIAANYISAVIPSQAIGRIFAEKHSGVIVNISSVAGILPLTRTIFYSNAKSACNSFTQWLAVHMAQEYSPRIRVNAIAPGFILTDLNRYLLLDEKTGEVSERGGEILRNVPAGRFGKPEEIVGAALWLVSDSASFVTGAVIVVDGGFTAFSGV